MTKAARRFLEAINISWDSLEPWEATAELGLSEYDREALLDMCEDDDDIGVVFAEVMAAIRNHVLASGGKVSDQKDVIFTTNGGYDSVLLVQNGKVISAWDVTEKVLNDYLNDTATALERDNWESHYLEDRIDDYGIEVGRNGTLSPERAAFYGKVGAK